MAPAKLSDEVCWQIVMPAGALEFASRRTIIEEPTLYDMKLDGPGSGGRESLERASRARNRFLRALLPLGRNI
jgi:hypothetical protein